MFEATRLLSNPCAPYRSQPRTPGPRNRGNSRRVLRPLRWFGLVECRQDPTSEFRAFWRKRALVDRFLRFDARVVRTEGSVH